MKTETALKPTQEYFLQLHQLLQPLETENILSMQGQL